VRVRNKQRKRRAQERMLQRNAHTGPPLLHLRHRIRRRRRLLAIRPPMPTPLPTTTVPTKVRHSPIQLQGPLTLRTTFRTQVSVQRIHSGKLLITAIARERPVIGVQLFMSFAIVLTSKAFATSRPVALERLLLVMRPDVS